MTKKPKAKENLAKDVETKTKIAESQRILIGLKVQLADAVIRREKLTIQLNRESDLCNRLATEIEKSS